MFTYERLNEGYWNAPQGVPIGEVIRRWREKGDKVYDSSMPLFFSPRSLWPYREYTWTRETARDGPAAWDAIKHSLQEEGWNPRFPLQMLIGREGGVKVGEGNHRLAVARELGITKIPVWFQFYTGRVKKSPQYPAAKSMPKLTKPRRAPTPSKGREPDELTQQIMDLLGF